MSSLAVALGIVIALTGLVGALSPDVVLGFRQWETPRSRLLAAGLRALMGIVLILAAEASLTPTGFRVIGVIALCAGGVFVLMPQPRWEAMVAGVRRRPDLYRVAAVLGALLGVFVAWSAPG